MCALIAVQTGLAGALLAVVPQRETLSGLALAAALLVFVLGVAAAQKFGVIVHIGRQAHGIWLSELPLVVGVPFLPLPLLLLCRLTVQSVILARQRRRGWDVKHWFNLALWSLETTLAVVVFRLMAGAAAIDEPRGWTALVIALVVASLVGTAFVNGVILATTGVRPQQLGAALVVPVVTSVGSTALGLAALAVLELDLRASWVLVVLGALGVLGYRAHRAQQRRQVSLERLDKFSRAVAKELHLETVALALLAEVREMFQADFAEVVVASPGEQPLRVVSREGELAAASSVAGSLARRVIDGTWDGEPCLLGAHSNQPAVRSSLESAGLKDALIAGLYEDNELVGTLLVADRVGDVDTFEESDRVLLAAVATHASVALANGRLADRLRREAAEKEHRSLHDELSGLPNRRMLLERLTVIAAEGRPAAVLLLDLDQFKEVNDTLGHQTGDALLVEVAQRLSECVRGDATVARLGGDEFVVLAPDVDAAQAEAMGRRVRDMLHFPIDVEDMKLQIDASVGAALTPAHGTDPQTLLQRADVAMYSAKRARSGFEVYAADRDRYSPRRLSLANELRQAIDDGAIVNHYQPKVDLRTGHAIGAEALARWEHPQLGMVRPDEFVPIAEQTGLMRPFTAHVLLQALADCAAWRAAGHDLCVAVNLSPRSLVDVGLADEVRDALATYELPPAALTLEITETSMMTDPQRTGAVLAQLSALGVGLSVDDFGTGYSSLGYLKRLPVDEVKIDRSFVQHLIEDPQDAAIVQGIVDLSHRLGKRVVAEGVEDRESYEKLVRMGCDEAQGYWLSRPVTKAALTEWLAEHEAAVESLTPLRRRKEATLPAARQRS